MKIFAAAAVIAASIATVSVAPEPVIASDGDTAFFQKVSGTWSGPGEIVAGKYKGTKFTCTLDGASLAASKGMNIEGSCRVGVFTQEMKATIERKGGNFKGLFLDGAKGKGLDITAGNISGNRATFSLNRKQLNGAMLARLSSNDDMNVTISVRVDSDMVPVIGMSLKRIDGVATGSLKQ